jgi:hypothetical protein
MNSLSMIHKMIHYKSLIKKFIESDANLHTFDIKYNCPKRSEDFLL